MGPIQVIPPGLMGLLQLKQDGKLPGNLSETVAPVLELRDWYLTARRLTELNLFGPVAPVVSLVAGALSGGKLFQAGGANAAVPGNQIWYVEQLTITATLTGAIAATDLLRMAPLISAAGIAQIVGPDASDYQLTARARELSCRADRGFWAFPGDIFGVRVYDVVTTNGWTVQLGLRATPCPI